MKVFLLSISFIFLAISGRAEILQRIKAMALDDDNPKIEWTDFEGAIDKNAKDRKLIFIDIYTAWCGWCKKMDQTTFVDPEIVEYMNEHFYAVKMDAESKEPIAFREVLYEHKMFNGKGYNELAVNLLGGKMSFPTFVILSKREVKIATINGYKNKSDLMVVLKKYAKK
jgi:thioredoxin-related protein